MNYIDIIGDHEYIGIGKYKDKSLKVYVPKFVVSEQDNTYMPPYIMLSTLCFVDEYDRNEQHVSDNVQNHVPRYILVDNSGKLSVIEMDIYKYDNLYMLNQQWKLLTGESVQTAINTFPYIILDDDCERIKNKFFYYMLPLNEDSAALLVSLKIGFFVMRYNEIKEYVYIPITNRKLTDIEFKKITAVSNAYKLLLKLKENC